MKVLQKLPMDTHGKDIGLEHASVLAQLLLQVKGQEESREFVRQLKRADDSESLFELHLLWSCCRGLLF